jgi:hypothetical protein
MDMGRWVFVMLRHRRLTLSSTIHLADIINPQDKHKEEKNEFT